jgi:NAD(P)-dependent dehydrogenase (short-subunit alcohol dehydrogenase family)
MQLDGIRAIVTGGASGLGAAVAEAVVAGGGLVTILDLNEVVGQAAAAALGERAAFLCVDVTDEAAVDATIEAATAAMGGLDLAVCCAGVGTPGKLLGRDGALPAAAFRKVIEINLVGTLLACKSAALRMQRNTPNAGGERGLIVMTASVAAFEGQIGQIAYAASKGGVVGMTLPMARELASQGIRVVTIAPGLFLTPMLKGLPQEAQDSLGKQVPFPSRLGAPSEYAALVRHAVENPMLNGTTLRLDGAIRMAPR